MKLKNTWLLVKYFKILDTTKGHFLKICFQRFWHFSYEKLYFLKYQSKRLLEKLSFSFLGLVSGKSPKKKPDDMVTLHSQLYTFWKNKMARYFRIFSFLLACFNPFLPSFSLSLPHSLPSCLPEFLIFLSVVPQICYVRTQSKQNVLLFTQFSVHHTVSWCHSAHDKSSI